MNDSSEEKITEILKSVLKKMDSDSQPSDQMLALSHHCEILRERLFKPESYNTFSTATLLAMYERFSDASDYQLSRQVGQIQSQLKLFKDVLEILPPDTADRKVADPDTIKCEEMLRKVLNEFGIGVAKSE